VYDEHLLSYNIVIVI